MKIIIINLLMLIPLSINAQMNGPFGFECNMPTGSPEYFNDLIGGAYKPESIAEYTTFEEAYFPVLIVYVQFQNDPGANVSWWPSDINGVPQAPTYMGNVIAEEKSTDFGSEWWNAYTQNNARLSDFWMEASRGELHLVGQEVHVVLPHEYTWYTPQNGGAAQVMEDLFSALAANTNINWPLFDLWKKENGTFVYGGNGDGYVDMVYIVGRSNPNGLLTPIGIYPACTHTSGEHIVHTATRTIKLKRHGILHEENSGFLIGGSQPLNAEYLVSFSAHEHGHYFFGYSNILDGYHQQYSKVNNYHGYEEYLSPYELIRLGYHTPQVADFSDVEMPIGDFVSFTTNSGSELIKVPIGTQNEFFIIANRQNTSTYDHLMWGDTAHDDCYRNLSSAAQDYDKGIYIYHAYPQFASSSGYPWGIPIDIECADGLWDWVQDGTQHPDWSDEQNIPYYKKNTPEYASNDNGGTDNSVQSLNNHDGLSIGYEPQGVWFGTGKRHTQICSPTNNVCDGTDRVFTNLKEVWTSREWKGDRWDAWKVGYNEVFSPYSSPSTVNWSNTATGIFIYLASMNSNTANMEVYKVGEGGWDLNEILAETPPSKPMLYKPVTLYNCSEDYANPRITWDNNLEPDMVRGGFTPYKRYKIYRAYQNSDAYIPVNYNHIAYYDDYTPNDTANFIDGDIYIYCGMGQNNNTSVYRYKVTAVDNTDWESVKSDFASIYGNPYNPDSPPSPETNIPFKFDLSQNYPNPFNPSTEIKFEIPKDALVTIKIYSVLGEEVAVLINNEWKTTGMHSVHFEGSHLASGIYFYTITAGTFTDTKKMVLIK